MSEYNKLSNDDDYNNAHSRQRIITDDSMSSTSVSRSAAYHNPLSSNSSISSKLSRSSRKLVKNSPELGVPLTSSLDDDESSGHWIGDRGGSPTSNGSATASGASHGKCSNGRFPGFAEKDPFYMFRGDLVKKLLLVDDELDRYLTVVRTSVSVL